MKKTCTKCGEEKDTICFGVDNQLKSGLSSYCRECKREKNRRESRLKRFLAPTKHAGISIERSMRDVKLTYLPRDPYDDKL